MTAPTLQVQFDPSIARFGASRSQKRLEDDRLLVGKGLYSDDRVFPEQAWLVVLRSPHAHAEIKGIDLGEARQASGVIAAWSMADLRADGVKYIPYPPLFKQANGSPMASPLRTPLAEDKVYYVGHPVAAIVARTRQQAQDAADAVLVEYADLPAVVDPRRAMGLNGQRRMDAAAGLNAGLLVGRQDVIVAIQGFAPPAAGIQVEDERIRRGDVQVAREHDLPAVEEQAKDAAALLEPQGDGRVERRWGREFLRQLIQRDFAVRSESHAHRAKLHGDRRCRAW